MDSTSPLHVDRDGNPIPWGGISARNRAQILDHLTKEGKDAMKKMGGDAFLDRVAEMLREAYQAAMEPG